LQKVEVAKRKTKTRKKSAKDEPPVIPLLLPRLERRQYSSLAVRRSSGKPEYGMDCIAATAPGP
jgi:hypothetical protein